MKKTSSNLLSLYFKHLILYNSIHYMNRVQQKQCSQQQQQQQQQNKHD